MAEPSSALPPGVCIADVAIDYFDQMIAPTLGDLPIQGVEHLRDQYIDAALLSDEAVAGLISWATASAASSPEVDRG